MPAKGLCPGHDATENAPRYDLTCDFMSRFGGGINISVLDENTGWTGDDVGSSRNCGRGSKCRIDVIT